MDNQVYIPKTKYQKSVIRAIWQTKYRPIHQEEIILPKGVVEIIFDLGENAPIQSKIYNTQSELAKCFINGFNTHPIHLQLPVHHFFFGVQFNPVTIKALFGVPANEFSNLTVDLTLISPLFHYLWQQIAEAKTFEERVHIITQWIESKMIQIYPREVLLNSFIETRNPTTSLNQIAETVCYSTRHLSRKISEITGMNAEQFLLYKKYLHAVHLMHTTELSLTEIAYDSHFTDQSHLTKSFKAFTQMTPKEYKQNKGYIPGHLYKNVR